MKRSVLVITLILLAATLSGCMMWSGSSPERDFPAGIRDEAYGALNYAKEVINSVGIHSVRDRPVRVRTVSGHRNYGAEGWSFMFYHDYWGEYREVMGVTYQDGYKVKVGHRPGDPYDISIPILQHEMAHHLLISNGYTDMSHYPEYDRYFAGWARGRAVTGRAIGGNGDVRVEENIYDGDDGTIIVTEIVREGD